MSEFPPTDPRHYTWLSPDEADTIPPMRLAAALDTGDLNVVREIIAAHPDWLNGFQRFAALEPPTIPLHFAAYREHVDIVRWLLTQGATPDGRRGTAGETPLYATVFQFRQFSLDNGHGADCVRIIRLLLDAGADPHADCGGRTPDGAHRVVHGIGLLDALIEFERRHSAA